MTACDVIVEVVESEPIRREFSYIIFIIITIIIIIIVVVVIIIIIINSIIIIIISNSIKYYFCICRQASYALPNNREVYDCKCSSIVIIL